MAITLTADDKKQAIASFRRYFAENWEQEVGDLKADLLLDFVLREGVCLLAAGVAAGAGLAR